MIPALVYHAIPTVLAQVQKTEQPSGTAAQQVDVMYVTRPLQAVFLQQAIIPNITRPKDTRAPPVTVQVQMQESSQVIRPML